MKTAVSVPDDLFERADRLARRSGRSRSDVYSVALREYVARHDLEEVTQAIDETLANLGDGAGTDPFVNEAGKRLLADSEW